MFISKAFKVVRRTQYSSTQYTVHSTQYTARAVHRAQYTVQSGFIHLLFSLHAPGREMCPCVAIDSTSTIVRPQDCRVSVDERHMLLFSMHHSSIGAATGAV